MTIKKICAVLASICLFIIMTGCSVSGSESSSNNPSELDDNVIEKTLFVGPEKVDCVGVAPQKCYKVREDPSEEWRFFYSEIAGFEYEPGYEYELLVHEIKVENPPADGSSLRWELIEVVSKEPVAE